MKQLVRLLEKILQYLIERDRRFEEATLSKLDTLIELLSPPEAVGFKVILGQKGEVSNMKAQKAKLDFTVFENGQATATLTPVDASGNATSMPAGAGVPVWTPADPSIVISASADGLSALLTAGTTPLTATSVSATATLADGTTQITGVSDPFDVVAQPPGAAVAFKIAIS